ncbi:MAG: hypothetical protein ACKOU6_15660, partial [Planctomycetota bacterium]
PRREGDPRREGEPRREGGPEGLRKFPPHLQPQAEKLEMAARRLQHLKVAVQNLKMAEIHDLAKQLGEKSEAMERELQEAKERFLQEVQREQAGARRPDQPRKPGGERESDVERDLREQVKRLQGELQDLRAKMEKR